jgi:hypothetical protein
MSLLTVHVKSYEFFTNMAGPDSTKAADADTPVCTAASFSEMVRTSILMDMQYKLTQMESPVQGNTECHLLQYHT